MRLTNRVRRHLASERGLAMRVIPVGRRWRAQVWDTATLREKARCEHQHRTQTAAFACALEMLPATLRLWS